MVSPAINRRRNDGERGRATIELYTRCATVLLAALQGYGISTSLAVRIYKKFGDKSGTVITQEPYRLAREVWGIGFKTADKSAKAVGIAHDAHARLQAGVLHALGSAADEGHTLLPASDLHSRAAALLEVEQAAIDGANAWQKFIHITLPMMRNIIAITVLFSLIVTFANFDIVRILTAGGPLDHTHIFATWAFRVGIEGSDIPLGASVSLFMVPILAVAAVFILRDVNKRGNEA